MPLETVTREQFREVFGDVSELTQPTVFLDPEGHRIITSFDNLKVEDHGHNHLTGVLETSPHDNKDRDPQDDPRSYPDDAYLIRVQYDNGYCQTGRTAKTRQTFRRTTREAWGEEKPEPSLTLLLGHMQYDFGPVSIYYRVMPVSSFHAGYNFLLNDPNSYKVSIEVMPNSPDLEEKPPLAQVSYTGGNIKVPLRGEFVSTEYDEALTNGVEERGTGSYEYAYFLSELLRGIRIGRTRFENKQRAELEGFEREAKLNPKRPYLLKGSPYKVGVYHRFPEMGPYRFGESRLSFARMNTKTGEEWLLSVPEWIDNKGFIRNLSGAMFRDFFYQYPAVFGVRRPGQEDQWFGTHGVSVREREILAAPSEPTLLA